MTTIALESPTFRNDLRTAMDGELKMSGQPNYLGILLEHDGRTVSLSAVLAEGRRQGGWYAFSGPDPEGLVEVVAREMLTHTEGDMP